MGGLLWLDWCMPCTSHAIPYWYADCIVCRLRARVAGQGEYLCQQQGPAVGCGCYLSALTNYHQVTTVCQKMPECLSFGCLGWWGYEQTYYPLARG
jgi:hypothetical protein